MNNNNIIIAGLVVIVIALIAWFAYSQGYLTGGKANKQDVEINLPVNDSPKSNY